MSEIRRIPFKTEHINSLDMHRTVLLPSNICVYEALSYDAQTILQDKKIVGCFGAVRSEPEIAQIWMLTGTDCGRGPMLNLTRYSEEWFNSLPATRLECFVHEDFHEGHRWIKMLGFDRTPDQAKAEPGWVEYTRQIAWAA